MTDTPTERIPAAERRERILAAASAVFGERGYSGTTTDQIAQAAGISQPYVVRMFGGKESLFVEVLDRALQKLLAAFRQAIADGRAAGLAGAELSSHIGAVYVDLVEDRGIVLSLMQGFVIGHDAVIGAKARAGFLEIYTLLREEAGMDPAAVRDFLAAGMYFNTLIALRMPDHYDDEASAHELLECAFGEKLNLVLHATQAAR